MKACGVWWYFWYFWLCVEERNFRANCSCGTCEPMAQDVSFLNGWELINSAFPEHGSAFLWWSPQYCLSSLCRQLLCREWWSRRETPCADSAGNGSGRSRKRRRERRKKRKRIHNVPWEGMYILNKNKEQVLRILTILFEKMSKNFKVVWNPKNKESLNRN